MSASEGFSFSLPRADDFHAHFRDYAISELAVSQASQRFARTVAMPNLQPPIKTVAEALAYRDRLLTLLPEGQVWEPLMMLYLTKDLTVEEVEKAAANPHVIAVKYYPEGVTTNSASGITDLRQCHEILKAMEAFKLPLSMHPETPDPSMDIYQVEADFMQRTVEDYLLTEFSQLPLVLEHLTVKESAQFLRTAPENVVGTVTPQHLTLTRDDLMKGGLKPHWFCYPVVKSEEDRLAMVNLVTSGFERVFVGTDSAPHPRVHKERAIANAGVYSHDSALEIYAEVFDGVLGLDTELGQSRLEAFLCSNGARFYGLTPNEGRVTLTKRPRSIPEFYQWDGGELVPIRAGKSLDWELNS